MLNWSVNSMLNNWILLTHKCRFTTWRCGSCCGCMFFTRFSDSTPRGGNIFYSGNLRSERRLSILVFSVLVGSEIGVFFWEIRPLPFVLAFFYFYWFMYAFIVAYSNCYVVSFLLSHTVYFTVKQNRISSKNYKTLFLSSLRQLTQHW